MPIVSIAFFLLHRLGGFGEQIRKLAGFVLASPARLWGFVAFLMALAALWQHHEFAKMAKYAAQTKSAWQAERKGAEVARAAAETRYRSLAHDADVHYAQGLAQGNLRLAAYIAAHRVQPAAQTHPASPAQSDAARFPAIAPAQAVVATIGDLQACDADYAYAQAAYDWARGLQP